MKIARDMNLERTINRDGSRSCCSMQDAPDMIRGVGFRSVAVTTMVAVALAGCANYETTLQYPGPDTVLTLPKPVKAEVVVSGEPKIADPSGWVHFRFNVNEEGKINNIEIVRSSNSTLEFAAKQLLNDWQFEPATADGKPVAFKDMEIVMGFSETTTPGEVIGTGVVVVVLLPLALLALFLGAAVGVSEAMD